MLLKNALIYDIETIPHFVYLFRLGKQVVRHGNLMKGYFSRPHIICIQYRWSHDKKARFLTWGNSVEGEAKMIKEFLNMAKRASLVIGKNSNRFDNKHVNTQSLFLDLEGCPEWLLKTDDLEAQMRRHFYLPSYSLDYISEQLGLGGKNVMEFSDWADISNYRFVQLHDSAYKIHPDSTKILFNDDLDSITKKGQKALKKMFDYGCKDTDDTYELIQHCAKHFRPKSVAKQLSANRNVPICTNCGSTHIKEDRKVEYGGHPFQVFYCENHKGYAGRCRIRKDGSYGYMLI